MKPMLARTFGPKYNKYPCYIQPKLNGVRALYHNGVFQSRDEKLWRSNVLHHLLNDLSTLCLGDTILDGELYVHGWPLQRINGAIAVDRVTPSIDTPSVEYHIFDAVDPTQNFADRWLDLANTLDNQGLRKCCIVPTAYVHSLSEVEQHFHHWVAQGYEGVMLRPDGPYEYGETEHGTQKRSQTLWKYKEWDEDTFICVGVTEGIGKADIGIGAFECAFRNADGVAVRFYVGSGLSDAQRIHYAANPPIGKRINVRYLCLTEAGVPFNPTFLEVMS
jgi:ATP-dependent DNA ligase